MLSDHQPTVIEEFNGWFNRGDPDNVPLDHFTDAENVRYIDGGFETRWGIDTLIAKGNVLRIYNYKMQTGESLLILDTNGDIYHALLDGSDTVYGPILSIASMTDFGFHAWAGRAYITPFATFLDDDGIEYQKGLQNEFLYVYKGDGTAARKAAGAAPTNGDDANLVAYNSDIDGLVDKGIHVIAVTFGDGADDSNALGPAVKPVIYSPGGKEINLNNIPTGGVGISERKIWMTHAIDPEAWNPDLSLLTFYLAKTITDNTSISTIISIDDIALTSSFSAGGLPPVTDAGVTVENTNTDGFCDLGLHVIGVVYETDTGYLTAPGPEVFGIQSFVNERKAIKITGIPTSPDSFVTKRHLVASKKIGLFNGDDRGFQLYFIPEGTIEDNTTTELTVSFYDIDLLEDASHLLDNFEEIPAGVTLNTYHGRLALSATFDDISICYLSAPGEPEAIDQVDGIIIIPLDGNPVTNAQEFRDVFYLFKKTRTYAVNDNGDEPSTWQPVVLDNGVGASVHGIATVLDSGGVNIDFLLIVDYSGIMVFNGSYTRPAGELTWKIEDYWLALDRNAFGNIQIINDSLSKKLYMTLPNKRMLYGDYTNGLDAKSIKWSKWRFDIETTTIALIETDTLVIGAEQEAA